MTAALVAVTALLTWGAAPGPGDPLEGCEELQSTMSLVTLGCPGDLTVYVDEADRSPERTLAKLQESLSSEGAPVGRQEVRMELGGVSRRVVRLASKESPYSWLTVTLPGSNGRSRFLGCGSTPTHEDRCVRVLDRLAGRGLPEPLAAKVRQPEKPEVAGRRLRLPPGCEVRRLSRTHGGVSCADGTYFGWAVGGPDLADAAYAAQVKSLTAGLPEGVWEEGVPCSAFRKAGNCRRGRGGKTEVVLGRWTLGESDLVAFCITLSEGIPDPCNQVMAVPPGVQVKAP